MKTLLIVLQLVPVLIDAIKGVESLIPESGKGKEKLALIESIISATYEGMTEIMPTIQKVIGIIVAAANSTGVFKKHKLSCNLKRAFYGDREQSLRNSMDAISTTELLEGINLLGPMIQGTWTLVSVLIMAVVAGAVWVTRISITVKSNQEQIKDVVDNISPATCKMHRDACEKLHQAELGNIGRTLDEIKIAIHSTDARLERYQADLMKSLQDG